MIGQTLWLEFFTNKDWPVASATAVVLLLLLVAPLWRRQIAIAAAACAATPHCGGLVDGGGGITRSLRSADCMISENTGAAARPP